MAPLHGNQEIWRLSVQRFRRKREDRLPLLEEGIDDMSIVHGFALLVGCLYGMVCEALGLNADF